MAHAADLDQSTPRPADYAGADARWRAVCDREGAADGHFFFAVTTTGIYCRPSCGARQPKRDNIVFFDTAEAAAAAGFRPCKRCRPASPSLAQKYAKIVGRACRAIEADDIAPSLDALARDAQMSTSHFHRIFKQATGITPAQYATATRAARMAGELRAGTGVTESLYAAGYGAPSRFYERAEQRLGMRPSAYRSGAPGTLLRHGTAKSWLGSVLVAATERGICAILLGDDENSLIADLGARFPAARLVRAEPGSDFDLWLTKALALLEAPAGEHDLPLDIRGTAFQERVWRALCGIRAGTTATYSDIAELIGQPSAARAVATACAANPLAVAVPCHRVVRANGQLSGYRWGVERKRALLKREAC
ncbi:bifunctional DNA-binding transcriptional regulator/O6-methylguanine-DNA methyltransferase Ada [Pacificimonas sp. ICDLI1SI03]